MKLYDHSPYDQSFKHQLDVYELQLWVNLDRVPLLDTTTQITVLRYLLGLACQATHIRNIELGRAALVALPRAWFLEQLDAVAASFLALNDDWEFRRLGEVYILLDQHRANIFLQQGSASTNANIREAAQDLLQILAHGGEGLQRRTQPDKALPVVWCDFNACGWSGNPDDRCFYIFAEPTFSRLPPKEHMRVFVWMEENETGTEVVGCEAVLEQFMDGWRACPDDSTWYSGCAWW